MAFYEIKRYFCCQCKQEEIMDYSEIKINSANRMLLEENNILCQWIYYRNVIKTCFQMVDIRIFIKSVRSIIIVRTCYILSVYVFAVRCKVVTLTKKYIILHIVTTTLSYMYINVSNIFKKRALLSLTHQFYKSKPHMVCVDTIKIS